MAQESKIAFKAPKLLLEAKHNVLLQPTGISEPEKLMVKLVMKLMLKLIMKLRLKLWS